MAQDSAPATRSVLELVTDYSTAQVVHVAVQLGLADLLGDDSLSVADLATATGTHLPSLARLVRMLAALGIVAEEADGRISLRPPGQQLRAGAPGSARERVLFLVGDSFWRSWGDLLYSVRTGCAAFDHVFGMSNFEYWERHPEVGAIHHAAFAALTEATSAPIVAAYDFARCGTVADIGGSTGSLLCAILAANPGVRGMLVDLPHVVAGAARVLAEAGVADRCTVVAGDFFAAVPSGADAYILKNIIHDWDDARAVSILKQCRRAMPAGAPLLVIEQVLPERLDLGAVAAARLDLLMLVLTGGGRERTTTEFRQVLHVADFQLQRVIGTRSPLSIVEALAC